MLFSLMLCNVNCTVYTVTPDDHYYPNTTCHHCHNLQHYLLNITKYFTSNTQLLFLPGLHHLHTGLIIQNVHNISLIGSTANDTTLDTVIQCNSSVGFVMANITNLTIRNAIIRNCTTNCSHAGMNSIKQSVIFMHNCYKIQMHYIEIHNVQLKTGLLAYNILGSFNLSKIKSKGIRIVYTDDYINSPNFEQAILNISQFKWITLKTEIAFNSNESDKIVNCFLAILENPLSLISSCIGYYDRIYGSKGNEITDSMKTPGIKLEILQTTYSVLVCISNATIENLYGDNLNSYLRFLNIELNGCNNSFQNLIYIKDLNFVNNTLRDNDRFITVSSMPCNTTKTKLDVIKLVNCKLPSPFSLLSSFSFHFQSIH